MPARLLPPRFCVCPVQAEPSLAAMLAGGAEGGVAGPIPSGFSQDIEEEANGHFQKIYSEAKPVDEVVDMLRGCKVSSNPRDQEVFACMVHNLFDEYR